jgi:superfamily II DNA helicase RecQ
LREHCNKVHKLQRKKDEELLRPVKLQSWFQDRRQRYWVVDNTAEARPATAVIHGVAQDAQSRSDGGDEGGSEGGSDEDDNNAEDQIAQEMQNWSNEVRERRLKLLEKVPVVELDSWLRFTGWNTVLGRSKHNIVQTYHFRRKPDPEEPELERLLVCWTRIFNRSLDTLADTDNPDVLKWFASPKNESMSKRPFQLPQNAQTISKYSGLYEHFICYALRTAPSDVNDEETETGVYFPKKQRIVINNIREMLKVDCLDDEYTDETEKDKELGEVLMHFCWMVLNQNMERETVYRSPLMHFLAVMGIDASAECLRHSFVYTPYLAGVLWVSRLLMLEYALPVRAWPVSKVVARVDVASVRARVKEVREKRLCEGSFSPVSFILGQLAYGKMLNRTYTAQSNIHWSDDYQTLYFKGRPIEIRKLEQFGRAVVIEAKTALQQLTFGEELPAIDLTQVRDTMSWSSELRKSAYSFVTDKRFGLDMGFAFLLQRVRQASNDLRLLKRGVDGKEYWNDRAVHSYLADDIRFRRKLMVAMHIMSLPGRGSEIGSIKFANSIYSARNIYVLNGRMAFVTCYDKSRSRRMTTEYIVRYLPDELSQVLAQYLVYVCPFARNLGRDESEYLFADKRGPWAGAELTVGLAEATARYLGVRLPVSQWRHAAIAVGDRFLHKGVKAFRDQEMPGVDVADGGGDDSDLEDEEEITTMAEVQVRQSGHGLRVARNHYAVDGAFLSRLGPELLWEFQRASLAWHKILKLESTGGKPSLSQGGHRRFASQELPSDGGKKSRLVVGSTRVKSEDEVRSQALVGLRKVFGAAAVPRSADQLDALQLVLNPPKSSVIVMRTAGGKSALFLVPAVLAEQKTVIVVVPYTALVDDLCSSAIAAGVDCKRWNRDYADGELHALVVVSADVAVDDDFLHYARGLELAGQLKAIFFDEGHVAFIDTSYRKKLRELWSLRYLDVPFVCLTATLPIKLEATLRERLCIPQATIFRRPTWRKTIRYRVVDTGTDSPVEAAFEYAESLQLLPTQRGVIYVRSYKVGREIADALDCPFYKAKAYDKASVLEAWVRGEGGWIVATGALGTGVNMPGIVYVLHIDRPYGMTSFVQQSGRGGRNGEVSDSVVFVGVQTTQAWRRFEVVSTYTVEQVDEDALTAYLQAQCCRRRVIGSYMDGLDNEVDCEAIDGILCDYCSIAFQQSVPGQEETKVKEEEDEEKSGSKVVQEKLAQEGKADAVLIEAVQRLSRRCVYCEVTQEQGAEALEAAEPHGYYECELASVGCKYEDFRAWRKELQLPEYLHCWLCGLPQWVCQVGEARETCLWPDVVLPVVYVLKQKGLFIEYVGSELGYQGSSEQDLREWLGSIVEGSGRDETYLTQAFQRFAELYIE